MDNPLITIITAAYRIDGLKKIVECLNNQIYRNFDHIIINDNNPEIREWFKENNYFKSDSNKHIVDNYTRCHTYGAVSRNIGAFMAFSYVRERDRNYDEEMITFLDDDNLWEPNHLESMVSISKGTDMVISDALWVGAKDKNWKKICHFQFRQGSVDLGQILYKRKLFTELGYFNFREEKRHCFDFELIKIFIDSGCKIVQTHLPTFIMNYKKK